MQEKVSRVAGFFRITQGINRGYASGFRCVSYVSGASEKERPGLLRNVGIVRRVDGTT